MKELLYIILLLFPLGLRAQVEKESQMTTPSTSTTKGVSEESPSPSKKRNETTYAAQKVIQQSQSAVLLQETRYQNTQKNESLSTERKRADLIENLERTAPNSPDYYMNVYLSSGRKNTSIGMLKKAYSMNSSSQKILEEMASYAYRTNDTKSLLSYLTQLHDKGFLRPSLAAYFDDLLASSPSNAVLIFHGFDDSYNALYEQQVKNKRSDVTLIDLDWLTNDDYRQFLKSKGFQLPSAELVDASYLRSFIDANPSKKIGVSMTLPKNYLERLPPDAQILGTAFWTHGAVSTSAVDWEKCQFIAKKPPVDALKWSKNYLPYLYSIENNFQGENAAKIKSKMLEIAEWNRVLEKVKPLLNP